MSKEKKVWSEPELIVMVRSRPEEAVLAACKKAGGSGLNAAFGQCRTTAGCKSCVANATS